MSFIPFSPDYGCNVVLTAAALSANTPIKAQSSQLRIVNNGANIAYVRPYASADGTVDATTADLAVAAGQSTTVTKSQAHDRLSYISALGTTLQVMTGQGA